MEDGKHLALKAAILRSVINGREDVEEGMDIETLVRIAFQESRQQTGGWMLTNDDERFRTAIAAAYTLASDEDKERIESEMRVLGTLTAAISGIPVDFAALKTEEKDAIGLMGIYKETAKEE